AAAGRGRDTAARLQRGGVGRGRPRQPPGATAAAGGPPPAPGQTRPLSPRSPRLSAPTGGAVAPVSFADLEKNELKPWQQKSWRIPTYGSGEFVCQMEDVLALYKLPADPGCPLVCLDETSKQ